MWRRSTVLVGVAIFAMLGMQLLVHVTRSQAQVDSQGDSAVNRPSPHVDFAVSPDLDRVERIRVESIGNDDYLAANPVVQPLRGRISPPMAKLRVRFVSPDGRVIAETTTDPRGNFVFEPMPPTQGTLQVVDLEKRTLSLEDVSPTVHTAESQDITLALTMDSRGQPVPVALVGSEDLHMAVAEPRIGSSRDTSSFVATTSFRQNAMANGSITGRVTAADTGLPFNEDLAISAYLVGDLSFLTYTHDIDANGGYTLTLPAGDYQLRFSPNLALGYLPEWYENVATRDEATTVTVSETETTSGIDVALELASAISGQITGEDTGEAVSSVRVAVYDEANNFVNSTVSFDGAYEFESLSAGNYTLMFDANYATSFADIRPYPVQYYGGAFTAETATPITLMAGDVMTDADVALVLGAVVKGNAYSEVTGHHIPNIDVNVYTSRESTTPSYSSYTSQGCFQTCFPEPYAMALPVGSYFFEATPRYSWEFDYLGEFYDNQPDLASADAFTVMAGDVITDFHFELATGGILEGTVSGENGGPPLAASVRVYTSTTASRSLRNDSTDDQGFYSFTGLTPGTYYLRFDPYLFDVVSARYLEEYYDDRPILLEADPITVTVNSSVTIDAELTVGGVISGFVTDQANGQPIDNVWVSLYDAVTGRFVDGDYTDDDTGYYELLPLPAGDYKLSFRTFSANPYISEYYDGKDDRDDADPISISAAENRQIDYQLTLGGIMTGFVTAADGGQILSDVYISLYRFDDCGNWDWFDSEYSDFDGSYRFDKLPTGTYEMHFDPSRSGSSAVRAYLPKTATSFDVVAGMTYTHNEMLDLGGVFAGTITDVDTALPLEGAVVDFYEEVAQNGGISYYWRGWAAADASGHYSSTGMVTGDYYYAVSPIAGTASHPYVRTGAFTPDASEHFPQHVDAGSVTTLNLTMELGGQVNGRVTAADNLSPLEDVIVNIIERDNNGNWFYRGWAETDANGVYTSTGVPTGSYMVSFSTPYYDHNDESRHYYGEYYDDKADDLASDLVAVSVGETVSEIDAVLARGGTIVGQASTADGGEGIYVYNVYLFDTNGHLVQNQYARWDSTTQSYFYWFYGVEPGTYFILVGNNWISQPEWLGSPCGSVEYVGIYYGQKSTFDEATPIVIDGTETISDIDVTISQSHPPYEWPNTITYAVEGTILDADDAPLSGVSVRADSGPVASTDENGDYLLVLTQGSHTVTPSNWGMYLHQINGN